MRHTHLNRNPHPTTGRLGPWHLPWHPTLLLDPSDVFGELHRYVQSDARQ